MQTQETTLEISLPQGSDAYVRTVLKIRGLQQQGFALLLAVYHEILEIERTNLWQEGPYQSFDRFLYEELGIAAQRWRHWCAVIDAYSESWVAKYGFESGITLLRLRSEPEKERIVIQQIEEMMEKRGGRPPSPDAVARVVNLAVPRQQPVGKIETESDRLRGEVHRLQTELQNVKKQLTVSQREIGKLQEALKKCKEKKSPKR